MSIRELRNKGGEVVDRVERGVLVTITRAGKPVAELRPLPRQRLEVNALLERWRRHPRVEPADLRRDIDAALDPRL